MAERHTVSHSLSPRRERDRIKKNSSWVEINLFTTIEKRIIVMIPLVIYIHTYMNSYEE